MGVVGDVHACDGPLALLLDRLREFEHVDAIWCVADIVNARATPTAAPRCPRPPALTLRGDHNRGWLLACASWRGLHVSFAVFPPLSPHPVTHV